MILNSGCALTCIMSLAEKTVVLEDSRVILSDSMAAEWKINEEVWVQFNAGPGASAGYVMDNSDRRGVVAGMSGMASFDFRFNSGLSVSAGFSRYSDVIRARKTEIRH